MKGGYCKNKGGFLVYFGDVKIWAKTRERAEKILTGLRYKTDEGTFDSRDYMASKPLSFRNLAAQWIGQKQKEVKHRSWLPLRNYMTRAIREWGDTNVKNIGYREIQKFLFEREDIASKTRANMKSALNQFFDWVADCEDVPKPKIPTVAFELGWRNIIDIETQDNVVNKVWKISHHINPKIWLGIHWLRTYISARPGEILSVKEGQINIPMGIIIIPHPKEKNPKLIYLLDEDIEFLKSLPRGLPELPFFRHEKGLKGVSGGAVFGPRYLYKWWKKACKEVGVESVDLYGGTRHSTVTALSKSLTPEEIKKGTMHSTNKAFERYFQKQSGDAKLVYREARNLQSVSSDNLVVFGSVKKS